MQLRQSLEDVGFKQHGPTPLLEDDQACVALSTGGGDYNRTKRMRYNYVLAKGEIKPIYISTEHQLADLTKALDKIKLARLRARVFGHELARHPGVCLPPGVGLL